MTDAFTDFSAQLRNYIRESLLSTGRSDSSFGDLALRLFRLHHTHNVAYRRLCDSRGIDANSVRQWRDIPAAPTAAFKELELTVLPPEQRTACFQSSGTTARDRSRHFHSEESLGVYEASLLPWFERHVLADVNNEEEERLIGALDTLPMLSLTPSPAAAPQSSLVYMIDAVRRQYGSRDSVFGGRVDAATGAWTLDLERVLFAIRKSMCANRPLVLLGTAFNFVHLLDHFAANNMRYRLARGTRVLETGGYKGQSREVTKRDLHALITKHLGVTAENIITEYGMCELSSQAYDASAGASGARLFRFPPWARTVVVSPENGVEVAEGETGLLRVYDLANVYSVVGIQTEDLAIRRGNGFELIGRIPQAEARGCSLFSTGS